MRISVPTVPVVVVEPVANTTLAAGLTAARASGLTRIDLRAASLLGVSAAVDVTSLAVRFRRCDHDRCRIQSELRLRLDADVEPPPRRRRRRLGIPFELELRASVAPEISLSTDGTLTVGLRRGSVRVEELRAEGPLGPGLAAALRTQLFRRALENVIGAAARAARGTRTAPTTLLATSGLAGPVEFRAYHRLALLTLRPEPRRVGIRPLRNPAGQ